MLKNINCKVIIIANTFIFEGQYQKVTYSRIDLDLITHTTSFFYNL